ncbi:MAG: TIGR04283 family arsenosugar biosynthesis glycosyltransferase [Betaproteobacteria bacterium]|nr:TIGR04283 family arsenosugar biosynthesis glycosyltransferase [Betaproteobacteria bacterium]
MTLLSVIVPTLNEAAGIVDSLQALQPLRRSGVEVIVADGGSDDDTRALAAPWVDAVVAAPPGRAVQMNVAAARARGDILLFPHADTELPPAADQLVERVLGQKDAVWGRFDVAIAASSRLLFVVAWMMNLRSRVTGIATGDQTIFVRREAFAVIGGYPEIPLMEDIELSRRLKLLRRPCCLKERVITSGRRWETRGTMRTIVLMWRLRLAYVMGADPARLAAEYGDASRQS